MTDIKKGDIVRIDYSQFKSKSNIGYFKNTKFIVEQVHIANYEVTVYSIGTLLPQVYIVNKNLIKSINKQLLLFEV